MRFPPPAAPAYDCASRVAVLLNRNARKVTEAVMARLRRREPRADFFFTRNLAEAEKALIEIATGRYDLLFTGGGDGTICHAITRLQTLCEGALPRIGILPLGTGNGIASYLGSPSPARCLSERHRAEAEQLAFVACDYQGRQAQAAFGGFGWDAFILDRYYRWRDLCSQTPLLKPLSQGLTGYILSGLGWAVPALAIQRPRWDIKVYNGAEDAWQMSVDGKIIERIRPGEVLFEGRVQLFSFGTCPYFGYRMKGLPHAGIYPDRMQLRLGDFSPIIPALKMKSLWDGTLQHPKLWDYLVSDCRVELNRDAALQLGGDIVDRVESFELTLGDPATCLRYQSIIGTPLPILHRAVA